MFNKTYKLATEKLEAYRESLISFSAVFVSRLITSYGNNEALSARAKNAVMLATAHSINELLIKHHYMQSYALSYVPVASSWAYKNDIVASFVPALGQTSASKILSAALAGGTSYFSFNHGMWDKITFPLSNLLLLKQNPHWTGSVKAAAFAISATEELAINCNNSYTNKHYLTSSIAFASLATQITGHSGMLPISVGAGMGVIFAEYADKILEYFFPVSMVKDSLAIFGDMSSDRDQLHLKLSRLMLLNFHMHIGMGLYSNYEAQETSAKYNKLFALINSINSTPYSEITKYGKDAVSFILKIIVPCIASGMLLSTVNVYYVYDLQNDLRNDLLSQVNTNLNFIKTKREAKFVIKDYLDDVSKITYRLLLEAEGDHYGLINHVFSLISKSLLLSSFSKQSFMLLGGMVVLDKSYNFFSQKLVKIKQLKMDNNRLLESNFIQLSNHDKFHYEVIAQRGGINFTDDRWHSTENDYAINLLQAKVVNDLGFYLDTIYKASVSSGILSFASLQMIYYKAIGANDFLLFREVFNDVKETICFSSIHKSDIENINSGVARLKELHKLLMLPNNEEQDYINFQVIEPEDSNGLWINALNFTRGDSERNTTVSIKNLHLKPGNNYLVTGSNGSGKSSSFTLLYLILNGIIDNSFKNIVANIAYPSTNFIIVSQKDYCPINASLIEIILFPLRIQELSETMKEFYYSRVKSLIRDLKVTGKDDENKLIAQLDLHKQDWCNELSGGQLKKLFLIKPLIDCPDILLLDETFGPLDKESKLLVANMLKNDLCLSQKTVIAIHHKHGNKVNTDEFFSLFDYELRFENGLVGSFSLHEHD